MIAAIGRIDLKTGPLTNLTAGGTGGKTCVWITDGNNNKSIRENDPIPSGWRIGRYVSGFHGKAGKRWINNGADKERTIDANTDTPEGWQRGRIKNPNFHGTRRFWLNATAAQKAAHAKACSDAQKRYYAEKRQR